MHKQTQPAGTAKRMGVDHAFRLTRAQFQGAPAQLFPGGLPGVCVKDKISYLGLFGIERRADGSVIAFEHVDFGQCRMFDHLVVNRMQEWMRDSVRQALHLEFVAAWRRRCGRDLRLIDLYRQFATDLERSMFAERMTELTDALIVQDKLAKIMHREFNRLLNADAMTLLRDILPDEELDLAAHNLVATNLAAWRLLERDAPQLLPLVIQHVRDGRIAFSERAFADLKASFRTAGLKESGWKALTRLSRDEVLRLIHERGPKQLVELANHLGDVGVPAEPALFDAMVKARFGRPALKVPVWFDQAALVPGSAGSSADRVRFAHNNYPVCLDWLRAFLAQGGAPDANQRKRGWEWIESQSRQWHEQQIHRDFDQSVRDWDSLIAPYQDGDYTVVPLVSAAQLRDEGRALHHCVATYANMCARGNSRIFSIRKEGRSVSTAEIVRHRGAWQFNQNRGFCNADPPRAVQEVARRIAARYNAAEAQMPAGQNHLRPEFRHERNVLHVDAARILAGVRTSMGAPTGFADLVARERSLQQRLAAAQRRA